MVLKGQFLERPTLVPLGKEVMEGLAHRGEKRPPLLILPPPPEVGGSMDHVVAAELAWAGATSGFPVLRFNHRGVGASQGKRGDADSRLDDAEAALRVLLENANTSSAALVAIGGAAETAIALKERHPGVSGIAFVSPRGLEPSDLLRLGVPLLLVMGAKEQQPARAALSAAVTEVDGQFELVDDADHTFTRNLPMVGKAVKGFLVRISGSALD